MSCPCDKLVHPLLRIDAGLERIPRQIARFPQFRRAMLAELGRHGALQSWRARSGDDLGIMLLEMWAYVCDVLSFYDEVIAHEVYLRTARRRPSLRKLVGRLGHIPRPAVAASVYLAAIAEGRKSVQLPTGTAFRSEAFDGEPPQVFELEREQQVHPQNNRWRLGPQRPATLGEAEKAETGGETTPEEVTKDHLLLEPTSVDLEPGDPILIGWGDSDAEKQVRVVSKVEPYQGKDGNSYVKAFFERLTLNEATQLEALRLSRPTQRAGLWKNTDLEKEVSLNTLHRQIQPGSFLLLSREGEYRCFKVTGVTEDKVQIIGELTTEVKDEEGNLTNTVDSPAVEAPVTKLTLHKDINADRGKKPEWTSAAAITVHYAFVDAGKVTVEAKTSLLGQASLVLAAPDGGSPEPLAEEHRPARLMLQDRNGNGHLVESEFEFEEDGRLSLEKHAFDPPLATPVDVVANVFRVSRGETVVREILGSGDASLAEQSFKLKKKPLTYLPAPTADNESGVAPVLTIWVDGIRWRRVRSFFGTRGEERVYIVRQNDEGESTVTFRRLPTGVDNVVARYRFGAGAKTPPAGGVHQLAKPVKGIASVSNPMAAFGGADAEGPEELRTAAPRSALLLGRAVSLADFEARAAGQPKVRAVRVQWRWHERRQQAVVQVWYIGDQGIETDVRKALRGIADPTVSIDVARARPRPLRLALDIKVDLDYVKDDVLAEVRRKLMNPETGILAPENIGIDRPLFRSRIFEQAVSVEGTVAVTALSYAMASSDGKAAFGNRWPRSPRQRLRKRMRAKGISPGYIPKTVSFSAIAIEPCDSPGDTCGRYFDLENGELLLSAQEDGDG